MREEFDFTIDGDSKNGGLYRGNYSAASEEAAFAMARRDMAAREAEENMLLIQGETRQLDGSLSRSPGSGYGDPSMGSGPGAGIGASGLVFAAVLFVLMVLLAFLL